MSATRAARSSRAPESTALTPPPVIASISVAVVSLLAYLALLSPVAGGKDGGEFVLVLARLGLAHPTGYPIYTLLGHAFVTALHGAGASWGWAANAWSALGGAIAMGLLHALFARLLAPTLGAGRAAFVAVLPLACVALNPVWTQETTLAEITSWHLVWVAGASLTAWRAARLLDSPRSSVTAVRGAALVWGVVLGLGAMHHTSSVLFALPLSVMLLMRVARSGRSLVTLVPTAIVGALLPLLALSYVAWHASHDGVARWPALEPGLQGVLDHVTGAQYRTFLGRFAPSPGQARLIATELAAPIAIGLIGSLVFLRRGDAFTRTLAVAVLLQTVACFFYGVADPASYFLPSLLVGVSLAAVALVSTAWARRHGTWLVGASLVLAAVIGVHGVGIAQARNRAITGLDALLRQMWARLPDEPGFVVWDDDMSYLLRGFQILEGEKPSLIVVAPRALTYPHEYARFKAAHGLDPLAGLTAPRPDDPEAQQRMLAGIEANLNRSALPVYEFLPQIPSIRRLTKSDTTGVALTSVR